MVGYVTAQYFLGVMYVNGYGVSQNNEIAIKRISLYLPQFTFVGKQERSGSYCAYS
jgi:hypothetical protein